MGHINSLRHAPGRSVVLAVASAFVFSACSTPLKPLQEDPDRLPAGRDFVEWVPRQYSPESFPVIEARQPAAVAPEGQLPRPTQNWWQEFGSAELDALVESALSNNYDLRVAVARLEQAERQAAIVASTRYPTLDFFAGADVRAPAGGVGLATSREDFSSRSTYQLGFRASYEVDVWGKVGYQVDSALASARASVFNRQAIALTLTAEVTTSYLQILALNERIAIASRNRETAKDIADAVSKRVERGDSSVLELQRQQVTIALIENGIANLRLQRERVINRLAVFLGQPAGTVKVEGSSLNGVKLPRVDPGLPSELLCRRPDIRRAEALLAAASADVNVARANLLPSVTLTAELGQGSLKLSELLRPESLLYSAAANLVTTVFDSDRRENQLAAARSRNRELLDTYANTVLAALRDVQDALVGIRLTGLQREALAEALARSNRLLELSQTIYDRGALEYVSLLDTQRDVFQAQDAEVNARFEQIRASIDLFRALGGGTLKENDPCIATPPAEVTPVASDVAAASTFTAASPSTVGSVGAGTESAIDELPAAGPTPTPTGHLIQLGAFSSEQRALDAWNEAKDRHPELRALISKVSQMERDGAMLFRMQAETGTKAQADLICRTLTDAGRPCLYIASGL